MWREGERERARGRVEKRVGHCGREGERERERGRAGGDCKKMAVHRRERQAERQSWGWGR